MKRRLLVLSISALLGISLLASCGPTTASTSKPDATSENPTTSEITTSEPSSSSSETLPELTITLTSTKSELSIGEDLELTVTVENNRDNLEATLTSSDETVISIIKKDNKQYAHAIKAGAATITLTVGTKTATLALTVKATPAIEGAAAVKHLQDAFAKAIEVEPTLLSGGTYHEKKATKDNKITQDDATTYNVYKDGKVTLKTVNSRKETLNTIYGIESNNLIIYQTSKAEGGEEKVTFKTTAKAIVAEPDYTQISEADAKAYVSLVDIALTGKVLNAGLVKGFYNSNLKNEKLFTKEDTLPSVKVETLAENTYKLTATGDRGYQFGDVSIAYTTTANGLLSSFEYTLVSYLKKDGAKGDLSNTYTVSATLKAEERVNAPADSVNLANLFYSDYQASLTLDGETVTTANVGQSLDVAVTNPAPATACDRIDKVTVKSVAPADAAEIGSDGTYISLLKETEKLTVVVTSKKGIEKTLTLKVNAPKIEAIEVWGLDGDLSTNVENEISISITPYELQDSAELSIWIEPSEGCDAEAYLNEWDAWVLFATTPGTATLKISSPYYVDETGTEIIWSQVVTFVAGEELTPVSVASSMIGLWRLQMGGDDTCMYMFTQTPDIEGTASGYYNIVHYGEAATGAFVVTYNEMDAMFEIEITPDADCALKVASMYFGMDMNTGMPSTHNITIEATDGAGEEVYINITNAEVIE